MKFGIEESTEMCHRCLIPFQIEQQFPLMKFYSKFSAHTSTAITEKRPN